jgi:hypothetical protein
LAIVLVVTSLACAVVISRRVDAFTNAQFYAEDGSKWFADAYTYGPLGALGLSYNGYFQIVSRLGAVVAAPFSILYAPLIYNIIGLLVQVAPVAFLLSSRFDTVVPSLRARLAVCAVYILMPSTELNVDITTAQFHLLVLTVLVIVAPEPRRWYWTAFDVVVVVLCGLSGPFAYILAPIAALWFIIRQRRFTLVLLALLAATIPIQLYAGLTSPRPHVALGATLHNLLLIVTDRIILAGSFAEEGGTHVVLANTSHGILFSVVICLLALPLVAFAAFRAPWELRIFDLTALGVAVSGLASPLVEHGWRMGDVDRFTGGRAVFPAGAGGLGCHPTVGRDAPSSCLDDADGVGRVCCDVCIRSVHGVAVPAVSELPLGAGSPRDHDCHPRDKTRSAHPAGWRMVDRYHRQVNCSGR